MRKSDVFDSFVKIALEKGLISEDAPEKAKKKLESNPRADSLDISAIEALYGVKPDAPKGMEYKRNIIENAHPESVIIAPSYDKLHGLVENENERQNITINIINRMPDGNITQHKYAEHDLLMTLVRVGNELDNQNKHALRELSDVCLEKISTATIKKQALVPAVIAGVSALVGALYLQQHLPFADEGFEANYRKLIAEVDDLIESHSNFGIGTDYTAEFKKMAVDLKSKLSNIYAAYERIKPIIMELDRPKDGEELAKMASSPESDTVVKAYRAFDQLTKETLKYIIQVQANFSSEGYKNRQVQNKGLLTSLVDKTQFLHGGKGLVSDDIDDVNRALTPFIASIQDLNNLMQKAGSYEKKAQQDIAQIAVKEKEYAPPQEEPKGPVEEADEHVGVLNNLFEGFKP